MPAKATSFALDSIAEWGKFPRFCVGVYRWGDKFFNSYDSTYVVGSGYKFSLKTKVDSWLDNYNFSLPNDMRIRMLSDPSTSVGLYLNYMAVSLGYDMNISKYFGANPKARKRFSFGFNCSLFACDLYFISNDVGTKIVRFGHRDEMYNPHLDFNGINISTFGLDVYYFFNHKKYSQAAAFNYSKIQLKSQGSFFAGFSYVTNSYDFDFSTLPQEMKDILPSTWPGYHYSANVKDYLFKLGYGYNWVFARHWNIGVSESPMIGLRKGFINSTDKENTTFALSNMLRLSVVWNNRRWYSGLVCDVNTGLIYDKDYTFSNAVFSFYATLGYRFNLW